LGKGSFGKVHLGKEILTDNFVAIKCIDKIYMKNDYSKMKILQEVLILKTLIHVNIIRLLEVFENSKKFFIVMEYASDGDLLTFMKEHGTLDEEKGKIIFR
jgi:serine/threonine protein kinase